MPARWVVRSGGLYGAMQALERTLCSGTSAAPAQMSINDMNRGRIILKGHRAYQCETPRDQGLPGRIGWEGIQVIHALDRPKRTPDDTSGEKSTFHAVHPNYERGSTVIIDSTLPVHAVTRSAPSSGQPMILLALDSNNVLAESSNEIHVL